MKYIIQYTLPYEHHVQVGIESDTQELAIGKAEDLFNNGDIWDDTKEIPLLLDIYEETGNTNVKMMFTIEGEITGDWPEPDTSVFEIRRQDAAFEAARLLREAIQPNSESGNLINWGLLNKAYEAAIKASRFTVQPTCTTPFAPCQQLVMEMKNGLVQSVMADRPDMAPAVAVIDHDVDGVESEVLCQITQSDGSNTNVVIEQHPVQIPDINFNAVFQKDK
ncbi:MAG: hypothetical protein OEZ39_14170 [Gammaproteobacteria bacterium]|nr:hypothetical protein [Gammaproteobacteria bacterium]MDH5652998.1 hypothetical protein [Gammaproteobacteria bacterium]